MKFLLINFIQNVLNMQNYKEKKINKIFIINCIIKTPLLIRSFPINNVHSAPLPIQNLWKSGVITVNNSFYIK
jgi:hypothetical protein